MMLIHCTYIHLTHSQCMMGKKTNMILIHSTHHIYPFDTFPIYDDQMLWRQFLEAEIYWEDDINAIEILRDEVQLLSSCKKILCLMVGDALSHFRMSQLSTSQSTFQITGRKSCCLKTQTSKRQGFLLIKIVSDQQSLEWTRLI